MESAKEYIVLKTKFAPLDHSVLLMSFARLVVMLKTEFAVKISNVKIQTASLKPVMWMTIVLMDSFVMRLANLQPVLAQPHQPMVQPLRLLLHPILALHPLVYQPIQQPLPNVL
jgi:hypothetical protein